MRNRIFNWITRSFGEFRHGDLINYTERNWDLEKKGKRFKVIEIKLAIQVKIYNADLINRDNFARWKKELDELTENSVTMYQCEDSDLYRKTREISQSGKSFLLTANIYYKREV